VALLGNEEVQDLFGELKSSPEIQIALSFIFSKSIAEISSQLS